MNAILEANIFYEIAALLILAAGAGFVGLMLRQPLIVSFIAVGIVAGPSVLNLARSDEQIELMAQLGIALLLFLVGLKLEFRLVKSLGKVALFTGLGQVGFTSGIGFVIGLALGYDAITSLYIAVALTFSSTIIIVKLLSDKRELDSLHGRVALGFLIVQDIVVVLAMVVLATIGMGQAEANGGGLGQIFLSAAALVGVTVLFVRYLADPLTEKLSRSPELLVSFAIGWAAFFASAGHFLGLGKELGGLLAGFSLASTPVREAISARLAPLRDFLLLFFFIALGAGLDLGAIGGSLFAAAVFSIFVLIGNPLIVVVIMRALGFRQRTGFLAGLTVAQISEFSLIFMAMGVTLGHVGGDALGMVTLVGLITIATSTYMITWSHQLYAWVEPVLAKFEARRLNAEETDESPPSARYDTIVFGAGRFGAALAEGLAESGQRVLAVDFSPETLRDIRGLGFETSYGDATDPEFLAHLPLGRASHVVSALPFHNTGLSHVSAFEALSDALTEQGFDGTLAAVANSREAAEIYQSAGADIVFQPYRDGARYAVEQLTGQDILAFVASEAR